VMTIGRLAPAYLGRLLPPLLPRQGPATAAGLQVWNIGPLDSHRWTDLDAPAQSHGSEGRARTVPLSAPAGKTGEAGSLRKCGTTASGVWRVHIRGE
jgi:hypothetical protein